MRRLALPMLLVLSACHTFNADVKVFCSASIESGLNPQEGFSTALATWVSEHVHTDEFRGIFKEMGVTSDTEEWVRQLDAAVVRAGLASCPTLEMIKASLKR